MLEVFFSHMGIYEKSPIRRQMDDLCRARWMAEPVKLYEWTPELTGCEPQSFQRSRRVLAEAAAQGPFYVLTDGDCFLGHSRGAYSVVELLKEHPEFAILSFLPQNCTIHPWTPEDYTPIVDENVMEHVSVGGIRVCAKGKQGGWPSQDRVGYDDTHARAIRRAGYRVGYAKQALYTHLGEGFSSIWPTFFATDI